MNNAYTKIFFGVLGLVLLFGIGIEFDISTTTTPTLVRGHWSDHTDRDGTNWQEYYFADVNGSRLGMVKRVNNTYWAETEALDLGQFESEEDAQKAVETKSTLGDN